MYYICVFIPEHPSFKNVPVLDAPYVFFIFFKHTNDRS